ncbi:MoaD/ThiS family protein [Aminobacter sp. HY435]|uniref:MoaD/ThiS family protein n=1 Tax=Aminobacter sp. HY435 TaxID=2970917 RepID=UPI0022B9554D|nr:MoaD/ThiS family protein [Aminobacter sp. HY435]
MDNSLAPDSSLAAALTTVVVRLPAVLVDLFPGAPRRIEVPASTVRDVVAELDRRWPGMRDRICDSRPAIRKHMNVFVEGERATLATPLEPGVEIFILTAISGG